VATGAHGSALSLVTVQLRAREICEASCHALNAATLAVKKPAALPLLEEPTREVAVFSHKTISFEHFLVIALPRCAYERDVL